MQANRILEEEELPFLTSNRICSVLIFSFEASLISFTASSLFLHSEGARGVARIEGSSKGRCEMPPSSWRNIIVMKWQFFSKANTEQDGFSYIPFPMETYLFHFIGVLQVTDFSYIQNRLNHLILLHKYQVPTHGVTHKWINGSGSLWNSNWAFKKKNEDQNLQLKNPLLYNASSLKISLCVWLNPLIEEGKNIWRWHHKIKTHCLQVQQCNKIREFRPYG